jgi:hypothetical protein
MRGFKNLVEVFIDLDDHAFSDLNRVYHVFSYLSTFTPSSILTI